MGSAGRWRALAAVPVLALVLQAGPAPTVTAETPPVEAEGERSDERAPGSEADGEEGAGEAPADPWVPTARPTPPNERFLQHALGTQGDVRLPALLLSFAAMVAVVAVAVRRWRRRNEQGR